MNHFEAAQTHLHVAILLTLSGGFLGAFTCIAHGKIFPNSTTGNIVLAMVLALFRRETGPRGQAKQ